MRAVFDAGVLLGVLDGELDGLAREVAEGRVAPYISAVNFAEVQYVLCRKLGVEAAEAVVRSLAKSRVVKVIDVPELHRLAAECKCKYPIALGDCYALALARLLGVKAYFRKEREMVEAAERDPSLRELVVFV